jgi:hypothetical protein
MNNFSNQVEQFYNDFHNKVKSRPHLYAKNKNYLTVVLPESLLEYANAAAGHSGFGAGARAVGIRVKSDNPLQMRDDVFESVESLEEFILSSDRSATEYIKRIRSGISKKKLVEIITDDRLIDTKGSRSLMSRRYGSDVFLKLGRKFGNKVVNNDIHTLTINEFELRYGLGA